MPRHEVTNSLELFDSNDSDNTTPQNKTLAVNFADTGYFFFVAFSFRIYIEPSLA
jgi:hypothetical protein